MARSGGSCSGLTPTSTKGPSRMRSLISCGHGSPIPDRTSRPCWFVAGTVRRPAWPTTLPTSGLWPLAAVVAGHLDDLFVTRPHAARAPWTAFWMPCARLRVHVAGARFAGSPRMTTTVPAAGTTRWPNPRCGSLTTCRSRRPRTDSGSSRDPGAVRGARCDQCPT
jgi:hypothetical protein